MLHLRKTLSAVVPSVGLVLTVLLVHAAGAYLEQLLGVTGA